MTGPKTSRIKLGVFAVLFVGAALTNLRCLGGECPCGAPTSDEFASHNLDFGGEHVVDSQCICSCGNDEPFARTKDFECELYDDPCEQEDGTAASLSCY